MYSTYFNTSIHIACWLEQDLGSPAAQAGSGPGWQRIAAAKSSTKIDQGCQLRTSSFLPWTGSWVKLFEAPFFDSNSEFEEIFGSLKKPSLEFGLKHSSMGNVFSCSQLGSKDVHQSFTYPTYPFHNNECWSSAASRAATVAGLQRFHKYQFRSVGFDFPTLKLCSLLFKFVQLYLKIAT